jgi:hypothetical protein
LSDKNGKWEINAILCFPHGNHLQEILLDDNLYIIHSHYSRRQLIKKKDKHTNYQKKETRSLLLSSASSSSAATSLVPDADDGDD